LSTADVLPENIEEREIHVPENINLAAPPRHVTHFKFIVPPKISLERLTLDTSDLVCMLIIASHSLQTTNCP